MVLGPQLNQSFSLSHNSPNAQKQFVNFIGRLVEVEVLVAILLGSNSPVFRNFVFFDQTSNFSNMYLL